MPGKILIVEDDPAIRALLRAVFEGNGHEVAEVADGLSALPAAQTGRPDIVLLDVGLPGLDGFGVLEQLKADPGLRDVPVIMVTAWAEPALVAKALDRGAHDYVRKPFDVKDLSDRVEAALAGGAGADFLTGDGASSADDDRRDLSTALERETQAARESGRPLALVHVALEGVDHVAATYGREVADEALRAVARRLRTAVRPADTVLPNGDAFAVLAPATPLEAAEALAEHLRAATARPLDTRAAALRLPAVVGAAEWAPGERPDELLARAARPQSVLA